MASSYAQFYVKSEDDSGVVANVGAGVSVAVRAAGSGSDAAESPLTTDSDGLIAAGSLTAVSAGTRVHFRVENVSGVAGTITQVTT